MMPGKTNALYKTANIIKQKYMTKESAAPKYPAST